MKRTVCFLWALGILLTLTACGREEALSAKPVRLQRLIFLFCRILFYIFINYFHQLLHLVSVLKLNFIHFFFHALPRIFKELRAGRTG